MNNSNIKAKAFQNWQAAEKLRTNSLYNSAASRLYYALFHFYYQKAVEEKFIGYNPPGVHEHVLNYIKTYHRSIERDYRKILNLRIKADYEEDLVDSALYNERYLMANKVYLYTTGS